MKYIITASRLNLGFPEEHNSDSAEDGKNTTQISYLPPSGCSSTSQPDRHWQHSQAEWVPHPPQSLLTPGPARVHPLPPWSAPADKQLAKPPPLRSLLPLFPSKFAGSSFVTPHSGEGPCSSCHLSRLVIPQPSLPRGDSRVDQPARACPHPFSGLGTPPHPVRGHPRLLLLAAS